MANEDLINFFYSSQKNKASLKEIIKFCNKSSASIYLTLNRWSKRGFINIRRRRKGDNTRIYRLNECGQKYVIYKKRASFQQNSRENRESKTQDDKTRY